MANITLSVPNELHESMRKFSEIRWSEIARRAIKQRIEELEEIEKISKKSKLTKKDVDKFSELIKRKASSKFLG